MNQISIGQSSIIAAVFSLTGATLASSSPVASTAPPQSLQPSTLKETDFPNMGKYQLAQVVSENCRQVSASSGVYVRREPTVYSTALGIIGGGRYVTVAPGGTSNWVPISAPLKGYVFRNFLTSCQSAPPPPSNCRQVSSARGGLSVRQNPSINSAIVGKVVNGRYVTIQNSGANGWVPISVPLQGYVSADYLVYCADPS